MALKDVSERIDLDSEAEIVQMVVQYFLELGFQTDDISLEDHFKVRLGTNDIVVGGREGKTALGARSDILVTHNGVNLAVIETKRPDHKLKDTDAEQSLSYARLLRQMAPFAIVTNGTDTKVFDVFSESLTELESPLASSWEKNGRQPLLLGDHLRFKSARRLFRFNPDAIVKFCNAQLRTGLSHVSGTIAQGRFYIPELFVSRNQIESEFEQWMYSDLPVFAIVGDSGTGKTNSMAALADQSSADHLVLFYQALRLQNGLVKTIQEDFIWEFHVERHISFFVERLSELANLHGRKIIVFLDGLDEFAGNDSLLRFELAELIQRTQSLPVKICISCKSAEWSSFVIDKGQTYNEFAKSVFPPRDSVHQPTTYSQPKPENVGVQLGNFSNDERTSAFRKYRSAFNLAGNLDGELAQECAYPLLMRLACEVYQDTELPLSGALSNIQIFKRYLDNRLDRLDIKYRSIARNILEKISTLSIENGVNLVGVSSLEREMQWTDDVRTTFYELDRLSVLRLVDGQSQELVTIGFERIRAFVYTTIVKQWQCADSDSTIQNAVHDIGIISTNALGLETIEFYFTHLDSGQTGLLTEIALANLHLFAELMLKLTLKNSLRDFSHETQADAYLERLKQFIKTHATIKSAHFPNLLPRILPYYGRDPQMSVTSFEEALANRPNDRNILRKRFAEFDRQGGMVQVDTSDLIDTLPEKFAWEVLLSDFAYLSKNMLLFEGHNPVILQERIWDILINRSCLDDSNEWKTHLQRLGYIDQQEIASVTVSQLLEEVQTYFNSAKDNANERTSSNFQTCSSKQNTMEIFRLNYWLELLEKLMSHIDVPKFSRRELYKALMDVNRTEEARELVEVLVQLVFAEYELLLRANFPSLLNGFSLYNFNKSKSILIEVWKSPSPYAGDLKYVTYALLPNVTHLPSNPFIVINHEAAITGFVPLMYSSSESVSESVGLGGGYGSAELDITIGGIRIREPEAILYRTTLDISLSMTGQVYQLVAVELFRRFGSTGDWFPGLSRKIDVLNLAIARDYVAIHERSNPPDSGL